MKTLTFCFCALISNLLYSQTNNKPIQVKATAGFLSPVFIDDRNKVGESIVYFDLFGKPQIVSSGSGTVLFTLPDNKVQLGISLFYEFIKQHSKTSLIFGSGEPYHVINRKSLLGIMPSVYYRYIVKRRFRQYAGLASGIVIINSKDLENTTKTNTIGLAYQFTAAGFEFGEKIIGILELGYGYKGVLAFGISKRF